VDLVICFFDRITGFAGFFFEKNKVKVTNHVNPVILSKNNSSQGQNYGTKVGAARRAKVYAGYNSENSTRDTRT
jgi:hypothetical protein